jgi:hypothetical protein
MIDDLASQSAEAEQRYAVAEEALQRLFGSATPDVPMNGESLAGLVLGFMYSHKLIPLDGVGVTAIIIAAYLIADRSDHRPQA